MDGVSMLPGVTPAAKVDVVVEVVEVVEEALVNTHLVFVKIPFWTSAYSSYGYRSCIIDGLCMAISRSQATGLPSCLCI